jgi:hypothetical protein
MAWFCSGESMEMPWIRIPAFLKVSIFLAKLTSCPLQ